MPSLSRGNDSQIRKRGIQLFALIYRFDTLPSWHSWAENVTADEANAKVANVHQYTYSIGEVWVETRVVPMDELFAYSPE